MRLGPQPGPIRWPQAAGAPVVRRGRAATLRKSGCKDSYFMNASELQVRTGAVNGE